MRILKINIFWLLLFVMTCFAFSRDSETIQDHFLNAKMAVIEQKWAQAITKLSEFLKNNPGNFAEEAQFWLGFSLERQASSPEKAFEAFTKLTQTYPNGTWADDAILHQITLAEKLIIIGKKSYLEFLVQMLDNPMDNIRYQAALALGRIEDERALPVLEKMLNDPELGLVAEKLINNIKNQEQPQRVKYMDFKNKSILHDNHNQTKDEAYYFSEEQFDLYKKLTKSENKWSRAELVTFGLWHVMPEKYFTQYYNMSDKDKELWYYIFWKKNDPTPTTEINEAMLEFEKRINYARENYYYFDNTENFAYAPWDARGELYIKYGEPQTKLTYPGGESWYYKFLETQFQIKNFVTNIFGRAITFGQVVHGKRFRGYSFHRQNVYWRDIPLSSDEIKLDDLKKYEFQYIFQPVFYYRYDHNGDKFNDFNCSIETKNSNVAVRYSFPLKELDIEKGEEGYYADWMERFVVYDQWMQPVLENETRKVIKNNSKKEIQKIKNIHENIFLGLSQGNYTLGFKVYNAAVNKYYVLMREFKVIE